MSNFTLFRVFKVGLEYANHGFNKTSYDRATKSDLRRWNSFYGISPEAVKICFDDLHTFDIGEHRIMQPLFINLCMTLNWLKEYRTEENLASHWPGVEDTNRRIIWAYIRALSAIAGRKIVWPCDGNNMPDVVYLATVDGVHFKVYELRLAPNKNFKGHKEKGAAFAYELAIGVWNGKLIWINGPFPAGENDVVIFKKQGGLKSKVPPGKRLIGDKIYLSQPEVTGRNSWDSEALAKFKERAKARHETFNRRLKSFTILNSCFRCKGPQEARMEKHKMVLHACCCLVQYDIENGHPLFTI